MKPAEDRAWDFAGQSAKAAEHEYWLINMKNSLSLFNCSPVRNLICLFQQRPMRIRIGGFLYEDR